MVGGTGEIIEVQLQDKKLQEYHKLIPETIKSLQAVANKLRGVKIAHVNATALGGGVAEMLSSQIPLEKDAGLDSHWFVIPANEEFFEITKSIHNYLQGKKGSLSERQKACFLDHNRLVAELLDEVDFDILIIHDPQPSAALHFMKNRPKLSLWRCHIDTTTPNQEVFDFLFPYLEDFDSYIFTMREFTSDRFPENKLCFMTPAIDPFSPKNKHMGREQAKSLLRKLGLDLGKPLVTQVSRFDPWKDPMGVVDAFTIAQKKVVDLQLAFVGQMAPDDPEGIEIYRKVRDYAKGKGGISFFIAAFEKTPGSQPGDESNADMSFSFTRETPPYKGGENVINLGDNDLMVNAFQTASDVILQKSIREGFALTVTEAMWKGAIVVGGNVGGIRLQIEDGVNGFLVNLPKEASERIVYILKNQKGFGKMRSYAHESVKSRFLMPHFILNELTLFRKLL